MPLLPVIKTENVSQPAPETKITMVQARSFYLRLVVYSWTVVCSLQPLSAQPDLNFKQSAITHLRKGEFIEALENLNLAIQKDPTQAELYYLRGYTKSSLEDYLGAEQDFTRSIDLSPYLADVFTSRAIARSQLSNFTGAMEDFSRALEMDTANPEIYLNRARTNLFLKKYYSSIIDCNKAIQLKFPGEIVYIIRASAEQNIKRYSGAIDDLNKALKINPASAACLSQRGLVWLDMNEVDSALLDFNRAVAIDSNNTFAIFNLALACTKKSDFHCALTHLDKVIRLSPYNAYAYYNRAIVLINLDDKKGAIRDFTLVSKLEPRNIISYYYRSKLKADLHDYQGALEDLDKTIGLLPDFADAYYERYEIKIRLKDRQGAKEDYTMALRLGERNRVHPDSLALGNKDYLQGLTKLSGDFEEMNTQTGKLQNQRVDVQLIPLFHLFQGRSDFDKLRLYDAYQKPFYHSHIVTLTNHPEIINDSLCRQEVIGLTRLIDSVPSNAENYYHRAVSNGALRNFNNSLADFQSAIQNDSNFVLFYFGRANIRYELIQVIISQEEQKNEITIGWGTPKANTPVHSGQMEHTYDAVIADYDAALKRDPEFPFAHYNRGFVNSTMGNYLAAVEDFTKAIQFRPNFAEAYYNRGLIYLLLNENRKGCEDLSRAGELGISEAYKVMKRYCYK